MSILTAPEHLICLGAMLDGQEIDHPAHPTYSLLLQALDPANERYVLGSLTLLYVGGEHFIAPNSAVNGSYQPGVRSSAHQKETWRFMLQLLPYLTPKETYHFLSVNDKLSEGVADRAKRNLRYPICLISSCPAGMSAERYSKRNNAVAQRGSDFYLTACEEWNKQWLETQNSNHQ